MPISKQDKEFAAYIVDLLQSIGPVYAKAMFGGHGIFLEGLMFGLIADRVLYLKADKDNQCEFISRQLPAFTYDKKGKATQLSYYQAPEEVMEDMEAMNYWGNLAYAAALRKNRNKRD